MATFGQIPSNVNFNNFQVVTSSTRPSSPDEGDHIFETDTKLVFIWNGAAWEPVSGQVVADETARDAFAAYQGLVTFLAADNRIDWYDGTAFQQLIDMYFQWDITYQSSLNSISTTETEKAQIDLSIPSTWNTYDVLLYGWCNITENGNVSQKTVTTRIRRGTTTGGTQLTFGQGGIDPSGGNVVKANIGMLYVDEGQTSTGTVSYIFSDQLNGEDTKVAAQPRVLFGLALRKT